MYIAIFRFEYRPVSEFCGKRTEHSCSLKSSRIIFDKPVDWPVREFCAKQSVVVSIPNTKLNKNPLGGLHAGFRGINICIGKA
jgi:hypothetical protein